MGGCINCPASEHHKKVTGHDYGFNHESMIDCMCGCGKYWFNGRPISINNPYYDPEELVKFAKKNGR